MIVIWCMLITVNVFPIRCTSKFNEWKLSSRLADIYVFDHFCQAAMISNF